MGLHWVAASTYCAGARCGGVRYATEPLDLELEFLRDNGDEGSDCEVGA